MMLRGRCASCPNFISPKIHTHPCLCCSFVSLQNDCHCKCHSCQHCSVPLTVCPCQQSFILDMIGNPPYTHLSEWVMYMHWQLL